MNFEIVSLGDIVTIKGGGTPNRQISTYWAGDIPWASVKDFKDASITKTQEYITIEGVKNSATNIIPAGTIIIPTRMAVGRVAINFVDMAINQDLKALLINDPIRVNRDYLFWFLKTKSSTFIEQAKGATVKGITLDVLRNLVVPLPPLDTQKQIATILEKADNLRKKCQQMEQELNALAQSVFLEMFGDPVKNTKGWSIVKLGDHASKIGSGSTPIGGDSSYKQSGIALIRSMNVHDGEFIHKNLAFIDEQQALKLANVEVMPNDILLNITGASVARVCCVPSDILPARVNQHVLIIRPISSFNAIFLEHLFLSAAMKQKLHQIAGAGATREAITKVQAEMLDIICPPIALQNQFAKISGLISSQKKHAHYSLKEQQSLFNALLQAMFNKRIDLSVLQKVSNVETWAR